MQNRPNKQSLRNSIEISQGSIGKNYFLAGLNLLRNPLTIEESKHLKNKEKNELILKRIENSIKFFQWSLKEGYSNAKAYQEITVNMKNSFSSAIRAESKLEDSITVSELKQKL